MNDVLVWAAVLGPVLIAEALLARHELLVYGVGLRMATSVLPEGIPYARGASVDRPPSAYVVFMDGIGKRRFGDSRDGGQLVKALLAGAPEMRLLGHVQPYSPLADPLSDQRLWAWLRRRAGLLLFLHNVMQVFVAADPRYRPLYNRAVGAQIADQLKLAGYEPDSGILVTLLSYSGAAQVATGAVEEIHAQLRSPILVIMLGSFHNGVNDLKHAEHVYQLTSPRDWIEPIGTWIFPQRWRVYRWSGWNRARQDGKVTVLELGPATHVGAYSYISPTALLPDGRSYLDRTTAIVISLIRERYSARGAIDLS